MEGPVAAQLRRRGVDAVSAHELERAGQSISDGEQLAFAAEQGRVLVTHDRHVVDLGTRLLPHPGVILLQRPMSFGEIIEYLELTSQLVTAAELRDRLYFCDW